MVTPARRRDPRSGKKRTGKRRTGSYTTKHHTPVKGYKTRKAERPKPSFSSSSNVFSESDISCCNQGGIPGNTTKKDNDENKEDSVDIVQDSLPLADSMEVCYIYQFLT